MANLQLSIPPSVLARFLSEVPPRDRDSVATTALIEALDRRSNMEHTKEMLPNFTPPTIEQPPTGTRRGRPPKGAVIDKRIYRSVGLSQTTWDLLGLTADNSEVSVNDAIEALLLGSLKPKT